MQASRESLPPSPDRASDLDDDFSSGLSADHWVPHYLPHWTTPDRSAACYRLTSDGIELRIEQDQLDWRPEDAPLRVSNLQTGSFSGPVGSERGTHRHRDDGLVVRTEHLSPADSGEICLFAIDADAVGPTTTARSGIKAHRDPRLTTDMIEVTVPLDVSHPHTWTAIWGDDETTIGCDGHVVRRMPQAPDYPLFLMIDLFEIGGPSGSYPKPAAIHGVRGWSGR